MFRDIQPATKNNTKFLESKSDTLIFVPIAIYIVVWSYISILRLNSLNATYFDLGSFMERLWFISHFNWNVPSFLAVFSNTGLEFLIFPLYYFKSYTLLLILQTIAIGACSLPLYGISKYYIGSKHISLLIALAFLIYFPVAGSNYFDVHFQAFFPILFISGYYFYLRKWYSLAFVFFILSGTVRYPYFIFPALFSILGLIEMFFVKSSKKLQFCGNISNHFYFNVAIVIISILFLYIRYAMSGALTAIPILASGSTNYQLSNRFLTIILLFGPLLFIPLISKKWVLFYLPIIFLVFRGPSIFYYPSIFNDQYAILIYSFIFLGFIDGISTISSNKKLTSKFVSMRKGIDIKNSSKGILTIIISVLIVLVAIDIAFEPYGPLNYRTNVNFGFSNNVINSSTDLALREAVAIIPANDPNVLTQNNLISLYPRPLLPENNATGLPLIAGMLNIGLGLTISEIDNNTIPFDTGFGTIHVRIDYVLADTNSSWFTFDSYGYPSMATLIQKLYSSGRYGIMMESNGIVLLKRNFHSSLTKYGPIQTWYNPNNFSIKNGAVSSNHYTGISNSTETDIKGLSSWYGPYLALAPDTYSASFYLSSKDIGRNNTVLLQATEWSINIEVLNLSLNNMSVTTHFVSIIFSIHQFLLHTEFRGVNPDFNGTLFFYGLKLSQMSPVYSNTTIIK